MFVNNLITRFQNGLSTRDVGDIFNSLPFPDPTKFHTFFDDFDTYTAAQWTVTETGAATQALTDGNNGLLLITNAAADDDASFSQKVGESFLFALGRPAFFRSVLQVSDATQSDLIIGLAITDVSPLDASDGVWFSKADGDTAVDFQAVKGAVAVTATAIADMADDTDMEFGFYWDGISRIWYSIDGTTMGYIDPGASLPDDEELTVTFGIQNGEAVAKTMTLDYIFAAMSR